jgi:hypothetical protein
MRRDEQGMLRDYLYSPKSSAIDTSRKLYSTGTRSPSPSFVLSNVSVLMRQVALLAVTAIQSDSLRGREA